jgi:hypothetical protein
MARDYEDLYGIENMGDDELKELVLQELREHGDLDVDLIEVHVNNGDVRLAGRVGTDQEVRTAEHVITDLLGIGNVANELVVDELTRGERSEAADDAMGEESTVDDQIGGGNLRTSDTAQHLMEDLDAEQFGTHDITNATARGTAYEPPDRSTQEGIGGGEDH